MQPVSAPTWLCGYTMWVEEGEIVCRSCVDGLLVAPRRRVVFAGEAVFRAALGVPVHRQQDGDAIPCALAEHGRGGVVSL